MLKNTILTFFQQTAGILVGLVTSIFIARLLGPDGQGQLALLILLPMMLYSFLNMGISPSTIYFLGRKETDRNTILKTNFYSTILLSLIALLAGFIVITLFHDKFFDGVPEKLLLLILPVAIPIFFNQNFRVFFQGIENFRSYNLTVLFEKISYLLLLVIALYFLKFQLMGAMASFIFTQLILLLLIVLLLSNDGFSLRKGAFSSDYLKGSLVYGIKSYLSNILAFLNYRIDILLISYFLETIEVGLYFLAVSIAEKLWVGSNSISAVLFARLSNMSSDKDKTHLTAMVSRHIFNLSCIGALITGLLSFWFIPLIFGNSFEGSIAPFLYLLPGIAFGAVSKIISNDFSGKGKPEINTYVAVFLLTENIILNIILIPKLGLVGAALATSITYSTNAIVKIIIFAKINKVRVSNCLFLRGSDLVLYKTLLFKLLNKGF
ncbi:oligosaccharide flippase family protein [Fulvivirgaceae bacterium BMA10]|uniref:Oligosaccharide flippase family protein n=1 Tax=Splendidivirga corallicola TaxID=3051826 RepID=A0ABT8KN48_9BACT|nr:oligosaccharide flippase family protein [Fulvivirgaceae bacterium BMA10]